MDVAIYLGGIFGGGGTGRGNLVSVSEEIMELGNATRLQAVCVSVSEKVSLTDRSWAQ